MTLPTDIFQSPTGLSKRRKQRRTSFLDHHHGLRDNAVTISRRATKKPESWNRQGVCFSFSSRKSHPATPLLPWRSAGTFPPVSVRKLAAELWCLDRSCTTSKEADRQIAASSVVPHAIVNRGVEWNVYPAHSDFNKVYGNNKKLFKSYMNDASEVTSLVSDLQLACTCVCKLETDHQKFRIKLLHLLMNLADERLAWQRMEFLRIQGKVDNFKNDLCRERKGRRKLEILNSKLNNEVIETKQSVKCFVQDYGKEKKARELIDQVCNELAKENGNNKAKKEAIKKESMKIRSEMEEEKEMLQLAETWRDERVQMKLLEAKGILEDKFSHLCRVKSDLETIIKSRSEVTDIVEVKQESGLSTSARNTNTVLAGNEFSHQPHSRTGTLFPNNVSQPEHAISACPNNPANMKSDDDGSGWETVSQDGEHSSSTEEEMCAPMGSMEAIRSPISDDGEQWKKKYEDKEKSIKLALVEQSSTIPPSTSKSRRSDNIDRSCNSITVDESHEKIKDAGLNLKESVEVGINSVKKDRRYCSPTPANPHVNRGIRGCIEWPKNSQKNVFRSNLLEAKIESQKVQLRQILKQRL